MPKELLVYRGWIGGKESDRNELEVLGVEVGRWNPIGAFDYCSMSAHVYTRFCAKWQGRYVWGLIGKKEVVYSKEETAAIDEDIPF